MILSASRAQIGYALYPQEDITRQERAEKTDALILERAQLLDPPDLELFTLLGLTIKIIDGAIAVAHQDKDRQSHTYHSLSFNRIGKHRRQGNAEGLRAIYARQNTALLEFLDVIDILEKRYKITLLQVENDRKYPNHLRIFYDLRDMNWSLPIRSFQDTGILSDIAGQYFLEKPYMKETRINTTNTDFMNDPNYRELILRLQKRKNPTEDAARVWVFE